MMNRMAQRRRVSDGSIGEREFARRLGVGRREFAGSLELLPEPDGGVHGGCRPRWQVATAARHLASVGRRMPSKSASWLLPGPDGPRLRRTEARVVTLQRRQTSGEAQRHTPVDPLRAHVATYTGPDSPERLWLVTPLSPANPNSFLVHRFARELWPHATPLAGLVARLTSDDPPRRRGRARRLLGTMVLLSTERGHPGPRRARVPAWARDTGVIDVFDRCDADELDAQMDVPRDCGLLPDVMAAVGHKLPFWPDGMATLDLVDAWNPYSGQTVSCTVPPGLGHAWEFRQLCAQTARDLGGDTRDGAALLALGRRLWAAETRHLVQGWPGGRFSNLPYDFEPEIWQVPMHLDLADSQLASADTVWEQGLMWVQRSPRTPERLARLAELYSGSIKSGL